jgi:hypothetical protein
MPPADLDVGGSASQRQTSVADANLKTPLVGSCGQHATVQVPSGQGHFETLLIFGQGLGHVSTARSFVFDG